MADDTRTPTAPSTGAVPAGLNVGADRQMDPATAPGTPSASGNPGADNPGVGSLGSGEAGVTFGSDTPRGFRNPDNVNNLPGGPGAEGGMGGTGLVGMTEQDEEERSQVLQNSGAPPL